MFVSFKQKRKEDQSGFSLLEMVVAMGILIVLVVGGILVYSGIQQNSKDAAVAQAAKSVYTGAVANQSDNDGSTTAKSAAKGYNDSQDSTVIVDGVERPMIYVTVDELDDGLRVTAVYGDDEAIHVIGGDGEAVNPDDNNPSPSVPGNIERVSFMCDDHRSVSAEMLSGQFQMSPVHFPVFYNAMVNGEWDEYDVMDETVKSEIRQAYPGIAFGIAYQILDTPAKKQAAQQITSQLADAQEAYFDQFDMGNPSGAENQERYRDFVVETNKHITDLGPVVCP